MFSTLLKEVTGYFDRRTLLSTFFPCLLFWLIGIATVSLTNSGYEATLHTWNSWPAGTQAWAIVGLLVVTSISALLLVNFRSSLVRSFEGYWPDRWPLNRIAQGKRSRCREQRRILSNRDEEFELQESLLAAEQEQCRSLADRIRDAAQAHPNFAPLFELKAMRSRNGEETTEHLVKQGESLRADWEAVLAQADKLVSSQQGIERCSHLSAAFRAHETRVETALKRVRASRSAITAALLLRWPSDDESVMPTILGNILKVAEEYSMTRYNLDAVVIWPRLAPLLPADVLDAMQNAESSVVLMLTLSVLSAAVGLPLAAYRATAAPHFFLPWLPMLAVVISILLSNRIALLASLSASLLSALVLILRGGILPELLELQTFLMITSGVLILASLCYDNAVEAAVDYGERIKSAIDLHRWKVLDAMHLQNPTDWKDERQIWEQVCGLLLRAYPPESRLYTYAVAGKERTAPKPMRKVLTPIRALPALRAILAEDLSEKEFDEATLAADVVVHEADLAGKLPLRELAANLPITSNLLIASNNLAGCTIVAIKTTPSLRLASLLNSGAHADAVVVPRDPDKKPVEYHNLLVLNPASDGTNDGPAIAFAVPEHEALQFLADAARGTVYLSAKHKVGTHAKGKENP
jgi:hypothetical protein